VTRLNRDRQIRDVKKRVKRHIKKARGGSSVGWELGLSPDLSAPRLIRRLIALPLVPPIRFDQAFQAVVLNSTNIPRRNAMNDYVLNAYVDANNALELLQTTRPYDQYMRRLPQFTELTFQVPYPYAFIAFLQQQDLLLERRVA